MFFSHDCSSWRCLVERVVSFFSPGVVLVNISQATVPNNPSDYCVIQTVSGRQTDCPDLRQAALPTLCKHQLKLSRVIVNKLEEGNNIVVESRNIYNTSLHVTGGPRFTSSTYWRFVVTSIILMYGIQMGELFGEQSGRIHRLVALYSEDIFVYIRRL